MMLETLAQRALPPQVYETMRGWRARFAPTGSSPDRLAGAVLWSGIAVGISNVAGLAIGAMLARILAVSRGQAWSNLLLIAIASGCQFVCAKALVSGGARGIALALLYAALIKVALQAIPYYTTRRRDRARDVVTV